MPISVSIDASALWSRRPLLCSASVARCAARPVARSATRERQPHAQREIVSFLPAQMNRGGPRIPLLSFDVHQLLLNFSARRACQVDKENEIMSNERVSDMGAVAAQRKIFGLERVLEEAGTSFNA